MADIVFCRACGWLNRGHTFIYLLCEGMEAVGVVIAVGPGLTDLQVGDIVAYALRTMGSYAEEHILPADRAVPVPSSIDPSINQLRSKQTIEQIFNSRMGQGSLACLKDRGHMVIFGQAPDPVPISALAVKSLYLTRPSLFQYTAKREELLETAEEAFANIANGVLRVRVNHKYPPSQAAQAHFDLESRKTTSSILLIPDGVES
ncbi:quinone oxidoreductase [Artemisia annua]|uniref:Quinone oxidoreductase n=1 Tax=Artemisia annua TaxID=35608 RepID=A0A2U1NX96_ARTAN|nr:quinone oxidoreductase [Artemisia annua]